MTDRWKRVADFYLLFAGDYPHLDRSEGAALKMFLFESRGEPLPDPWGNAYFVGKHWMDVTAAHWEWAWRRGLLSRGEVHRDPEFLPHAKVLEKVFPLEVS